MSSGCFVGLNYSNGDYYHYTYDAVGNRLTQQKSIIGLVTTDTYVYDDANRLTSVNGVNYTWDANGNLLNDGTKTYTYDPANRLTAISGQQLAVSYAYNGLGDRLQEVHNGQTTNFTMDLNAGLTQALSDGTNNYIYGIGRIAQVNTGTEYFLGDALGSVRQLTNTSGTITYASAYDPYGVTTQTHGAAQTAYGYTGEYTSDDLIYLRARHYNPGIARFLTKDIWEGNANSPMSFNRWMYVKGNPINFTDPSGYFPVNTSQILSQALSQYSSASNSITTLVSLYDCSPLSERDSKHYDLTWWLALAMSRHDDDARVKDIASDIDYISNSFMMPLETKAELLLIAYKKFYNLEGPWKVWDIKRKIFKELGYGIVLCGATCDWFDYSTPGNIHFGFIAYRSKIHQGVAAVAGGVLEQLDAALKEHKLYPEYCSQNASKLYCDNPGDQAAVDFGYMLAEKYKNTPTITETILRSELTPFWMSKFQRPPSGFIPPHPAYRDIEVDYSADHFNN